MRDAEADIRWSVIDPLERQVVLKESTYEAHILNDHGGKVGKQREFLEETAKTVVEKPRFIIRDRTEASRAKYLQLIGIPVEGSIKIRSLTVVVDESREPCEVITWIPQNRLKECVLEGEVIYYEKNDRLSRK